MTNRGKRWAKSFGYRGCMVSVYELSNGFIEARKAVRGAASVRCALGHQDRKRAMEWAKAEQAKLELGLSVVDAEKPTAGRIISAYLEKRTPLKASANTRQQDDRAGEMWLEVLGAVTDLSEVSHDDLDRFAKDRLSGAIDAHGKPVAKLTERKPVRVRAVGADLEFLRAVVRWAHEQPRAKQLLPTNPMRGYTIPKAPNPRRPVASQDRYEDLQAVAERVHPFFAEILALANETGRRISAVLGLRYQDLRLSEGKCGAIVWPADTDKMGAEWSAPMSPATRGAVDGLLSRRPGIGAAYLFPSPKHQGQPVSKDLALAWLEKGERLAGLAHLERGGFHAYRRKWGTERKHEPIQDVAKAGGWKSLAVLQTIYQQPDSETMQRVVNEPRRLREAK